MHETLWYVIRVTRELLESMTLILIIMIGIHDGILPNNFIIIGMIHFILQTIKIVRFETNQYSAVKKS